MNHDEVVAYWEEFAADARARLGDEEIARRVKRIQWDWETEQARRQKEVAHQRTLNEHQAMKVGVRMLEWSNKRAARAGGHESKALHETGDLRRQPGTSAATHPLNAGPPQLSALGVESWRDGPPNLSHMLAQASMDRAKRELDEMFERLRREGWK